MLWDEQGGDRHMHSDRQTDGRQRGRDKLQERQRRLFLSFLDTVMMMQMEMQIGDWNMGTCKNLSKGFENYKTKNAK